MTWVAMWMFASFHSTSLPFIQILPVPANAMKRLLNEILAQSPNRHTPVRPPRTRRSVLKAELRAHVAAPGCGHAQRAAVEILDDPPLLQGDLQERSAEGAAEVRPPLAPV